MVVGRAGFAAVGEAAAGPGSVVVVAAAFALGRLDPAADLVEAGRTGSEVVLAVGPAADLDLVAGLRVAASGPGSDLATVDVERCHHPTSN